MVTARHELITYDDRSERAQYLVDQFGTLMQGCVLDVGCSRRDIARVKSDMQEYVGIDISEEADIQIDLEKAERLPFDDGRFDFVICTEVLEHLDSLHRVFDELVRVAAPGGHIIVSLPNCWRNLRSRIAKGRGRPQYYGLPVERPMDLHKWFINAEDIIEFFHAQPTRMPIEVAETRVHERRGNVIRRAMRRVLYPSQLAYYNRYALSVWTLFRKR